MGETESEGSAITDVLQGTQPVGGGGGGSSLNFSIRLFALGVFKRTLYILILNLICFE